MLNLRQKAATLLTESKNPAIEDQKREFGKTAAAAFKAANQKLDWYHEVIEIGNAQIVASCGTGPLPNAHNLMNHVLMQHRLAEQNAADVRRNAGAHFGPGERY